MIKAKANEQVTIEQIGGSQTMAGWLWTQAVSERARLSEENATLHQQLTEARAANERLTRWRDLAIAAATAGAEQEVFQRFTESEAIQPIIQAWKDKVAEAEAIILRQQETICTVKEQLAEARTEQHLRTNQTATLGQPTTEAPR